jgi:shikimate kinase/3-dehydroquinate synthase
MGDLRPALVFIGFMGAGKSTAARAAAAAEGVEAADTDRLIEAEIGMPIARYFDEHGEEAFRTREEEVVGATLEAADGGAIALGGGSLGSVRVRAALERHIAVWLDLPVEEAWTRAQRKDRPLARDRNRFGELYAARISTYEECADAVVPARREVVPRALPALRSLAAAPAGTRLLWATSASGDYPVHVGQGLAASGFWPVAGRRFLVTDSNVGPLHAAALPPMEAAVQIAAGEASKTLAQAEEVLRELARSRMTRADHVAALGGGVVGDLAGFCAATYQRGVPVVHVPTTLVAQVDSAYGGKTGVDLPEAKNYVGAYHQPAAVLVDPSLLQTLPAPERAAGYAEVVKTALLAGGSLWDRVRAGAVDDESVILACARTKLGVVAADERDAGPRQALNLGHTIGHAIETVTGYRRYRHGEAVALGLLAALRLSEQIELRDEVATLLAGQGLPTTLEGADPGDVVAATARDKKRMGESVPFVLLDAPGRARTGCAVGLDELTRAVEELTR